MVKRRLLPLCPSSRTVGLGPADSTSSGLHFATPAFPNLPDQKPSPFKNVFVKGPQASSCRYSSFHLGWPLKPGEFNILNADHSHCVQLGNSAFNWRLWLHFNSRCVWRWQWAVVSDSLRRGFSRSIMDGLSRSITQSHTLAHTWGHWGSERRFLTSHLVPRWLQRKQRSWASVSPLTSLLWGRICSANSKFSGSQSSQHFWAGSPNCFSFNRSLRLGDQR